MSPSILLLSSLLLFSCAANGADDVDELKSDLESLDSRVYDMKYSLNEQISRIKEEQEKALKGQKELNEEQAIEIAHLKEDQESLKLKVERLESLLAPGLKTDADSKIKKPRASVKVKMELQRLFRKKSREESDVIRIAELINEAGIGWISRTEILANGPRVLFDLTLHYKESDLLDIIKELIANDANVRYEGKDEETALVNVCLRYEEANKLEIVEMLVLANIFFSREGLSNEQLCRNYKKQEFGKLLTKSYRKEEDVIRIGELIKELGIDWVDKNETRLHGPRVLHDLSNYYKNSDLIDILKVLISAGVDVNYKNAHGNALVHVCLNNNKGSLLELVKLLISAGADVKARNLFENTPLQLLAIYYEGDDLLELFKLLVAAGADVKNVDRSESRNVLHNLCRNYKNEKLLDVVKYLISVGAEVNKQDLFKDKPFDFCKDRYNQKNKAEVLKLLQ